jgi:hypothetical protein
VRHQVFGGFAPFDVADVGEKEEKGVEKKRKWKNHREEAKREK